jgi:hypothetical protein
LPENGRPGGAAKDVVSAARITSMVATTLPATTSQSTGWRRGDRRQRRVDPGAAS